LLRLITANYTQSKFEKNKKIVRQILKLSDKS
jgi:ribosomal protein S17E